MSLRALPLPGPREAEEPPPQLEPDSFAERLYLALGPLAQDDDEQGFALLIFCNALGRMFQTVEDYVRDSPEGPGWSALTDLDRCPPEALPWLGQFVGVRVLTGSTPADQRQRIATHDGWHRGTPAAIRGAAQATLTGTKTVVFRERDGDPYFLTVVTYTSETPNQQATQDAILAQKPAGLVLSYRKQPGQDWQSVKTNQTTWAAAKTRYPDWTAVLVDQPPT